VSAFAVSGNKGGHIVPASFSVSLRDWISNSVIQSLESISALYQLVRGKLSFLAD
jgi:hypothetical protein